MKPLRCIRFAQVTESDGKLGLASLHGETIPMEGIAACRAVKAQEAVLAEGPCSYEEFHARLLTRGVRIDSDLARSYYNPWPGHDDVPGKDCRCGWYGVPRTTSVRDLLLKFCWPEAGDMPPGTAIFNSNWVVLETELAGKYFEHEHGIRAEYQRVTGIRTLPCACYSGAKWIFSYNHAAEVPAWPVRDCPHDSVRSIDRQQRLARELSVPVSWGSAEIGGGF